LSGVPQSIATNPEASGQDGPSIGALGSWLLDRGRSLGDRVDFLGATLLACHRLVRDRPLQERRRLLTVFLEAGVGSLPILALMGWTAGFVLTLIGSKELGKLGVETGIPRLVGIVVLREIGCLIVGIALAGRVASSYAAELAALRRDGGTGLRLSDELMQLEVAPRVLALVAAAPLLLAYTNAMAVVGGMLYGTGSLISAREQASAMLSALALRHVAAAFSKATAFGFVVALSGCYHGLRGGGTPEEIGRPVRRAVVGAVIGVGVAEVALIFAFKWLRF
jgi:phospholipid/cholesterol/gamma-HCH transport system permease protein